MSRLKSIARERLGRDATEEELALEIAKLSPRFLPLNSANMMLFAPRNVAYPPDLNDDEKLSTALCFSLTVAAKYIMDGRVYIRELDPELRRAHEIISPVFETDGKSREKNFKGFRVEYSDESELASLYRSTPKAAQFITTCIATNIQLGIPLTGFFKVIGIGLVAGTLRRPSVPPVKPSLEHRNTLLVHLADRMRDNLEIPGGASKTKFIEGDLPPACGCAIAAAAMKALGVSISMKTSVEVWHNRRCHLLKTGSNASRDLLCVSESDITTKSIESLRSSSAFAEAMKFLSTPIK